jgi:hypothetical protein
MADDDVEDAVQNEAAEPADEGVEIGANGPVGYTPSTVESTRLREQGGGVGQTDLNQQRDPTTRDSSEKY